MTGVECPRHFFLLPFARFSLLFKYGMETGSPFIGIRNADARDGRDQRDTGQF